VIWLTNALSVWRELCIMACSGLAVIGMVYALETYWDLKYD